MAPEACPEAVLEALAGLRLGDYCRANLRAACLIASGGWQSNTLGPAIVYASPGSIDSGARSASCSKPWTA